MTNDLCKRQLLEALIELKADDHKLDTRTVSKIDEAIDLLKSDIADTEKLSRLLYVIGFIIQQFPKYAALIKSLVE